MAIDTTIHALTKVGVYEYKISDTRTSAYQYVAVRWDTDDSITLDEYAAEALKLLAQGIRVEEVAKKLDASIHTVELFIRHLEDSNFIKSINGIEISDAGKKISPIPTFIPQQILRIIIDKNILVLAFVFVISGLIIGLYYQDFLPSYTHFFWTNDLLLVLVSLTFFGIIHLFIHEWAHVIATYAVGGVASLKISHRFISIVAVTESYHLGLLEKKQRYLVYLAGLFIDFFLISLNYWLILLGRITGNSQFESILKFDTVILIGNVVWQFNIFLETDMYNFLSEYMDDEHLRANTIKKFLHVLARFTSYIPQFLQERFENLISHYPYGEADDLRTLNKGQKNRMMIYMIILMVGLGGALGELIFLRLPREAYFIYKSIIDILINGLLWNWTHILKSLFVIFLLIYQYLILYILTKKAKGVRKVYR